MTKERLDRIWNGIKRSAFWFPKISNDSKWSEHVVTVRDNNYEHALGLLVYLFRRAPITFPTHSKEISAWSHNREESDGTVSALAAIDEDAEMKN